MVRKGNEAQLGFEALEQRMLLAAVVEVAGGDLGIRGDAGNNSIIVSQLANGSYLVGSPTDVLEVDAGNPNLATFTTASGNIIVVANGRVVDDVKVVTGDGNDIVAVVNSNVFRDIFNFAGFAPFAINKNVIIPDNLKIETGNGNDQVTLQNVGVRGNALIDLGSAGAGATALDTLLITETIANTAVVRGDLDILGGAGRQEVELQGLTVDDKTDIRLGAGNDLAVIGNGNVFRDRASIRLEDGNDTLQIGNSTFKKRASASGGSGTDTLAANGGHFDSRPSFTSFENR